jgi:hypothetical protein
MENNLEFTYTRNARIGRIIVNSLLGFLLFICAIFFFIGLITLISTGLVLASLPFLIPSIGMGLFLLLGLLSFKWNQRYELVKSSFDIAESKFKIKLYSGNESTIPFSEINTIDMRKHIVRGKNSSTTYYVLHLIKKDGAFWDFQTYGAELTALKALSDIKAKINFENSFPLIDEEISKEKNFSLTETSFETIFHWIGRTFLYQKILTVLGILGFMSVFFYFILGVAGSENTVFFNVLLLFVSIFFLGISYMVFKSFFAFNEFELVIKDSKLTLFGIKKTIRKEISFLDISKIQNTQYAFDIYKNNGANPFEILILTKETKSILEKIKSGPKDVGSVIQFIKESIELEKQIMKLTFPGFTPVEILCFEKALDRELKKQNPDIH